jgi:hypothetical protein
VLPHATAFGRIDEAEAFKQIVWTKSPRIVVKRRVHFNDPGA